jgi:hypothetical protein
MHAEDETQQIYDNFHFFFWYHPHPTEKKKKKKKKAQTQTHARTDIAKYRNTLKFPLPRPFALVCSFLLLFWWGMLRRLGKCTA